MSPRLSRLSNGLRVVSLSMPGISTAAVALNADVGARHELDHEHGLAHLFEHMLFKGTHNRTARAIAEEIEDVGGSLNAWTSRDATVFHGRVLGQDLPLAVGMIADLVTAPRFDEQDLEREREVILSEIGEALETPDDLVFDHLQLAAYPEQPLGRPILGTEESLARLDSDLLRGWLQRQYRASGLVLAAAGAVDHDRLVEDAERLFGAISEGSPEPSPAARWRGGQIGDSMHNEQLHLALGFEGPASTAPDYHAAHLFVTALGGGMSSRLFQELREERGLAYSVSAAHIPHSDTGVMSIYFATRPADASEALDLCRVLALETARSLDEAELARAKAQAKAGLLMGLEGPGGQAEWLGRCLLTHGRLLSPEEVVASLEQVTVEEARAAGANMLAGSPALAAVGPGAERLAA